jgi:phage virion morphogenesis protein
MPQVAVRFNASVWLSRLNHILEHSEHLQPAIQEAAEYMVRSTRNRITGKKSDRHAPDGEPWAPLSEMTIEKKGHNQILYQSGELLDSIHIENVTNDGFTVIADSPHASYMQSGVKRTNGWVKGKKIPARPFIGFSEANIRRIAKILRDYIDSDIHGHGSDE